MDLIAVKEQFLKSLTKVLPIAHFWHKNKFSSTIVLKNRLLMELFWKGYTVKGVKFELKFSDKRFQILYYPEYHKSVPSRNHLSQTLDELIDTYLNNSLIASFDFNFSTLALVEYNDYRTKAPFFFGLFYNPEPIVEKFCVSFDELKEKWSMFKQILIENIIKCCFVFTQEYLNKRRPPVTYLLPKINYLKHMKYILSLCFEDPNNFENITHAVWFIAYMGFRDLLHHLLRVRGHFVLHVSEYNSKEFPTAHKITDASKNFKKIYLDEQHYSLIHKDHVAALNLILTLRPDILEKVYFLDTGRCYFDYQNTWFRYTDFVHPTFYQLTYSYLKDKWYFSLENWLEWYRGGQNEDMSHDSS